MLVLRGGAVLLSSGGAAGELVRRLRELGAEAVLVREKLPCG